MNFDLDDPLGSDDSFFEEPKTIGKKTSATKSNVKKSIENLFGPAEKEIKTQSSTDIVDTSVRTKHIVTFEDDVKNDSGVSLVQKPKDEWLIGSDSRTLDSKSGKNTNLFDDILSIRPKQSAKKMSSLDDILKDSKASKKAEKDISSTKHIVSNLGFSVANHERRRPRKGSATGIEDTLGLFEEEILKKDVSKSTEDIKSNAKYDKGRKLDYIY